MIQLHETYQEIRDKAIEVEELIRQLNSAHPLHQLMLKDILEVQSIALQRLDDNQQKG